MGRSVAMLAGFLGLTPAIPAWATTSESYVLVLHTAPGCPTAEQLRADVVAHVSDPSRAAGARVELRVEPAGAGFAGELVSTDPTGHEGRRRIEGQTCAEVAHALAFLAGLAIDLGGRTDTNVVTSDPSTIADSPHLETSALPPPPPSPSSSPPLEVSVVVLSEFRGGLGPEPGLASALGVEIGRPIGRILAPSVLAALDGGTSRLSFPQGAADLSLGCARLLLCPLRFQWNAVAVRPCAGAEVGAVYASGSAPVQPRSALEPWASLEGGLRVQWRVTARFFVDAEGGASRPLVRARYFFEPHQTVYAVPAWTGRGALGVGFRL
jgi:hypothetical protein